jgi:hypothetical protein
MKRLLLAALLWTVLIPAKSTFSADSTIHLHSPVPRDLSALGPIIKTFNVTDRCERDESFRSLSPAMFSFRVFPSQLTNARVTRVRIDAELALPRRLRTVYDRTNSAPSSMEGSRIGDVLDDGRDPYLTQSFILTAWDANGFSSHTRVPFNYPPGPNSIIASLDRPAVEAVFDATSRYPEVEREIVAKGWVWALTTNAHVRNVERIEFHYLGRQPQTVLTRPALTFTQDNYTQPTTRTVIWFGGPGRRPPAGKTEFTFKAYRLFPVCDTASDWTNVIRY